MSTIVVIKDSDTLILATDSRTMEHDFSGIVSDEQEKIFQIGPETFIATSGRQVACDFQLSRARELAAESTDIESIGAALARETLPCLVRLVERLRLESDERTKQAVSGESLIHATVIVGRTAGGLLGYVAHSYKVVDGTIECETEAYFEARRKITATSGAPVAVFMALLSSFAQDMATWLDPPEQVVVRLLESMKQSSPTIGGANQVVCLDNNGAHWIARHPQAAARPVAELQSATLVALASLISPVISGGSFTGVTMDLASAAYNAGGNYSLGDLVTYASVQYRSLANGNYNHQPDVNPGWWVVRPSLTGASISGGTVTGGAIIGGSLLIATGFGTAAIGPGTNGLEVSSGSNLARAMPSAFFISAGLVSSALSPASLVIGTGGSATAALAPTGLLIGALPSSSPGSKQFWYDPADGNKVKYTP